MRSPGLVPLRLPLPRERMPTFGHDVIAPGEVRGVVGVRAGSSSSARSSRGGSPSARWSWSWPSSKKAAARGRGVLRPGGRRRLDQHEGGDRRAHDGRRVARSAHPYIANCTRTTGAPRRGCGGWPHRGRGRSTCSRTAFSCRRTSRFNGPVRRRRSRPDRHRRELDRSRRADRAVGRAAGVPNDRRSTRAVSSRPARPANARPVVGLRVRAAARHRPDARHVPALARAAAAASRPSVPDDGARRRPAGIRRGTRTGLAASRDRRRRAGGAPSRRLGRRTRRCDAVRPRRRMPAFGDVAAGGRDADLDVRPGDPTGRAAPRGRTVTRAATRPAAARVVAEPRHVAVAREDAGVVTQDVAGHASVHRDAGAAAGGEEIGGARARRRSRGCQAPVS